MSSLGDAGAWPEAVRRRLPTSLTVIRLGFAITLGFLLWMWVDFRQWQERTIVVDAETGAVDIELESELSGKALRNVWKCERVEYDGAQSEAPPRTVGCAPRTHHLVGPERLSTPTLPAEADLRITSSPGMVRIDVIALPGRFQGTDLWALDGGALILMDREALDAFGTLSLTGNVRIGADFAETDRRSTVRARYEIRGQVPSDRLVTRVRDLSCRVVGLMCRTEAPDDTGNLRTLRSDALLGGALVRFASTEGETTRGSVGIMLPDPQTDLMQVTAISEHSTDTLGVRYYFTKEVRLRPSFLEALLLDPVFQVLVAVFGAIAGYGWLKKLTGVIGRRS